MKPGNQLLENESQICRGETIFQKMKYEQTVNVVRLNVSRDIGIEMICNGWEFNRLTFIGSFIKDDVENLCNVMGDFNVHISNNNGFSQDILTNFIVIMIHTV